MKAKIERGSEIKCPRCEKELEIDSLRRHKSGRTRIYWECEVCGISIMDRGNIK